MSKQLPIFQFLAELLRNWRQCLAFGDDSKSYQSSDIDIIAARLREDFVRLPVLRFLKLDPICTYTNNPLLFRWAQMLCTTCQKQNDCSLMAANAQAMPAFDNYCSNASLVHQRVGRSEHNPLPIR
jgi:hypothetical protein